MWIAIADFFLFIYAGILLQIDYNSDFYINIPINYGQYFNIIVIT